MTRLPKGNTRRITGSAYDVLRMSSYRLLWLACLIYFVSCSDKGTTEASTKYYISTHPINKAKINKLQGSILESHGIYLDSLKRENHLLFAGPLNDTTGMVIYQGPNLETVEMWVRNDPAVKNELLFYSLSEWNVVIGRSDLQSYQ